jgi:hypothetical protein
MTEPFWLRPVDEIEYPDLVEFLEEGNEEHDNLEYKMPKLDQNGRVVFDGEFRETLEGV